MSHIHKLDTQLINQIAAGEVVERPISVVKELVENSLDAGATRIRVSLESGGTKLIEVSDNGSGIARDDLPLVFEKHATSKISSLQDLQNVLSFGFRGEALASISSVADTTLFSRQRGQIEGYSISSENPEIHIVSCEEGTKIRVENLFARTPARLNYLKTERTEYAKIVEFLQAMALAYPEVSFEILSEGKRVWYFAEGEDLKTRVYQIYGAEFALHMIPLNSDTGTFQISGIITKPTISFGNKNKQLLFVNHRLIQSPAIYRAVADAYNRYIAPKTFSGYVLHLQIDPSVVDVNVHPRKMELRFADEQAVFRGVYSAVSSALEKVSLISASLQEREPSVSPLSRGQDHSSRINGGDSHVFQEQFYTGSGTKFKSYSPYTQMRENPSQGKVFEALEFSARVFWKELTPTLSWEEREQYGIDTSLHSQWQDIHDTQEQENFDLHETPLGRIIGQVHRSYILVETPTGMQLYDQHALAERINYEKLKKYTQNPSVQKLLIPEMIQLSPLEKDIVETYQEAFSLLGFEIEILSHALVSISSIPDIIKKSHISEIFRGILEDVGTSGQAKSQTLEEFQNRLFAYTACRSAIKFWDKLNLFEMHALLKDAVSDYSASCPHGRPVIWEVSLGELKKKYER